MMVKLRTSAGWWGGRFVYTPTNMIQVFRASFGQGAAPPATFAGSNSVSVGGGASVGGGLAGAIVKVGD